MTHVDSDRNMMERQRRRREKLEEWWQYIGAPLAWQHRYSLFVVGGFLLLNLGALAYFSQTRDDVAATETFVSGTVQTRPSSVTDGPGIAGDDDPAPSGSTRGTATKNGTTEASSSTSDPTTTTAPSSTSGTKLTTTTTSATSTSVTGSTSATSPTTDPATTDGTSSTVTSSPSTSETLDTTTTIDSGTTSTTKRTGKRPPHKDD